MSYGKDKFSPVRPSAKTLPGKSDISEESAKTSAMSSPGKTHESHLDFLDSLRGLAILAVFLYHCFQTLGLPGGKNGIPTFSSWIQTPLCLWAAFPLSFGWVGVALFFVISGFCIHLSHIRSRDRSFRTFFVRRFFRIYPPYLIALLFFALVLPTSKLEFAEPHDTTDFLMHLFLVHNFDAFSIITINGAFWSIAVEAQLYLIYPILLALLSFMGWNRTLILLLVIGVFFVNIPSLRFYLTPGLSGSLNSLSRSPLSYWFCWAIGARIADDWTKNRTVFLGQSRLWVAVAGFMACCLIEPLNRFAFILGSVASAILIARLLVSPKEPKAPIPIVGHLRKIGIISYSIYLLHLPFIDMLPHILGPTHKLLIFTVGLLEWPVICGLAWVFYRFVEQPSNLIGKKILALKNVNRPMGPA